LAILFFITCKKLKKEILQSIRSIFIPKFDDDVLIACHNGKLPNPVYLAYYQINNMKFKCDNTTYPKTILIGGRMHIYGYGIGIY